MRALGMIVALAALLLAAPRAVAAADAAAAEDPGRSAPAQAIPANGVDQPPRRGTFAGMTLGLFTTMGGSRAFSNGQPYLGITVGHELGETATIFAALGIGASSASCFQFDSRGNCAAADSFGATFLEAGASYGFLIAPRLVFSGKLVGGVTLLSPGPITNKDGRTVPDNVFGPHGGAGLALDYDTHLDHFAVGIDTLVRYSLANTSDGSHLGVASLAIMPRVRYVF